MNDCPNIDELLASDNLLEMREHVKHCEECRDIAELAATAGPPEDDDACSHAELLMAITANEELTAGDAGILEQHLGACARCNQAAQSLLLDIDPAPARTEQPAWSPAKEPEPIAPQRRSASRLWVGAGAGVAIAAVVAIFIAAGGSKKEIAGGVGNDDSAPAGARTGPDPRTNPPTNPPTTNPPRTNPTAAVVDAGVASLVDSGPVPHPGTRIEQALDRDDTEGALVVCEELFAKWPKDDHLTMQCVAAACSAGKNRRAKRYMRELPPNARAKASKLCKALVERARKASDEAQKERDKPATSGDPSKETTKQLLAALGPAVKAQEFPRAYAICQELSKRRGLRQRARTKCVLAACNDRNASKAKRYFRGLRSQSSKAMMESLCLSKGVRLR